MTNGLPEIKCPYCGSTVIVPEELRGLVVNQGDDQVSAKDDMGTLKHVQWLMQNGLDGTAKVNSVEDTGQVKNANPMVTLELDVNPKAGKSFFACAFINVPRNAIPRVGEKLQIKSSPEEETDLAIQIGGQYYQDIPAFDPNLL
jgi:hypothetical protein